MASELVSVSEVSDNYAGYVEVFLAATRIGAITLLLDIACSATGCLNTLKTTGE
jgi:hypothetical protein